jgi:hypothetical protein
MEVLAAEAERAAVHACLVAAQCLLAARFATTPGRLAHAWPCAGWLGLGAANAAGWLTLVGSGGWQVGQGNCMLALVLLAMSAPWPHLPEPLLVAVPMVALALLLLAWSVMLAHNAGFALALVDSGRLALIRSGEPVPELRSGVPQGSPTPSG